jgi:RNA polymerase sigma factor (TIGR02999 family)
MAEPSGERGPAVARDLFEVVYQELRRLASFHLNQEHIGHTLNPTALVHEAYLRLTRNSNQWSNKKQFFLAASEAMRHILVDHARYHSRQKRTGGKVRQYLPIELISAKQQPDLLDIHDAIEVLAVEQPEAAELVKLRYFAGLTLDEAAAILELTASTADRRWAFAKAWLFERLSNAEDVEQLES